MTGAVRRFPRERKAYRQMVYRCTVPSSPAWAGYGGRGITVCARWLQSFDNFLADMGPRPSGEHSIGRVDNDGNYAPENCRWETRAQQMRNTRRAVIIEHDGRQRPLMEVAQELGILYQTLWKRVRRGRPLLGRVSP